MTATIEELEPTRRPRRTFTLRPSVREALWGFVFIGPWLIGILLFTAGPMLASLGDASSTSRLCGAILAIGKAKAA